MMIKRTPVNMQIAKKDVPYWAEKIDLVRRIARLEEENTTIQEQLKKLVHIITRQKYFAIH